MKKKAVLLWKSFTTEKAFLIYAVLIFGFLLARDPFGTRTLISNFEPFPDSFHYVVPARSLVQGEGFYITREGRNIAPSVPPMYSLFLVPFYFINLEARVFYFANVALSLISLLLFYLILKKIVNNKWILGFSLLLFSTNYYLYWYPQWAMAENLLLPLFLLGVYLLVANVSLIKIVLFSFAVVAIVSTKYAFLPISIAFFIIYLYKMFKSKKSYKPTFANKYAIYFGSLFLLALPAFLYAGRTINLNLIQFLEYFTKGSPMTINYAEMGEFGSSWFSTDNFKNNLLFYWRGLKGEKARFLWETAPILPKYLSLFGLSGLIFGLFSKKYRFLSLSLFFLLLSQILFISLFWAADMRYIYHAIPTLLLGIAVILATLYNLLSKKRKTLAYYLIISTTLLIYLIPNTVRIKNQVVLNLKYAETPWYYISVLNLNEYFSDNETLKEGRPVVISPMVPYYIDFFSNGNYDLLPLSLEQDFRKNRHLVWGPGDYSDLHGLYKEHLSKGRKLYVATYGLGNEAYLHDAFNSLMENFKLTEVDNKCYEQCKIYSLE